MWYIQLETKSVFFAFASIYVLLCFFVLNFETGGLRNRNATQKIIKLRTHMNTYLHTKYPVHVYPVFISNMLLWTNECHQLRAAASLGRLMMLNVVAVVVATTFSFSILNM